MHLGQSGVDVTLNPLCAFSRNNRQGWGRFFAVLPGEGSGAAKFPEAGAAKGSNLGDGCPVPGLFDEVCGFPGLSAPPRRAGPADERPGAPSFVVWMRRKDRG